MRRMRPMRRTAKQDSPVSRLIVIVAFLAMAAVFVFAVAS
jgi:hypothetical protein